MATKTKTATPKVVYNDLEKTDRAKTEDSIVKVKANDPGVLWIWETFAAIANDQNLCGVYDRAVKELGGPPRSSFKQKYYSGYYKTRYADSLSAKDETGKERTQRDIVFKGKADLMGTPIEFSYTVRLYTSGTAEDVEYVYQFKEGKPFQQLLTAGLKRAHAKKVKELTESNLEVSLA